MKSFSLFLEQVSQKQIKALEIFADRLLDKFDVDVEFTKHFADRMNDSRNHPDISIDELVTLFKKIAKDEAKKIKKYADSEAVLNDIQSDLNLPIVIKVDRKNGEIDVIHKTIIRKHKFFTKNKVLKF